MLDVTQKTGYVRINVSDKSAIWLNGTKGTELRAAASAEGRRPPEPVALRALGNQASESPASTLPIPADQLPEGIWAVKGSFRRFGNMVLGQLGICRTDEQKVVWQCDVRVTSSTGDTAVGAGTMQLPGLEKISLNVSAKPSNGKLGVGVHLTASINQVSDVRKYGKPVLVQVSVTDASGNEVGAKEGAVDRFRVLLRRRRRRLRGRNKDAYVRRGDGRSPVGSAVKARRGSSCRSGEFPAKALFLGGREDMAGEPVSEAGAGWSRRNVADAGIALIGFGLVVLGTVGGLMDAALKLFCITCRLRQSSEQRHSVTPNDFIPGLWTYI